MRVSSHELQNFARVISAVRLAGNDDSEACDSIFQTGHRLAPNAVR